ncbi:hypothetical protein EVAR_37219_1 [Eumeta japonica]|uniref:Uncharacterized protein n=1 Tax=Eumeta variegata TaxID=151549 RepID=A0A4C1Y9K3_EUMVA|nr:hypothetical protein EVAR_37219_1 [Eumeta japonica]
MQSRVHRKLNRSREPLNLVLVFGRAGDENRLLQNKVTQHPIKSTPSLPNSLPPFRSDTAGWLLARLLLLDIWVREAAKLCELKRGKELGDISADWKFERPVDFCKLLHPAHTSGFGFESVADLDSSTMDRLAIVGPHIYTDGSRIEGKDRAALTEWRDDTEYWNSAYRFESFCVVFQAEMFALHRALWRVKKARQDNRDIVAEGREVRLFWMRAHADTAGNEHADELANNVILKRKTAADYDRFPLLYAKKAIRAASLDQWQQRYAEGSTGASFPG